MSFEGYPYDRDIIYRSNSIIRAQHARFAPVAPRRRASKHSRGCTTRTSASQTKTWHFNLVPPDGGGRADILSSCYPSTLGSRDKGSKIDDILRAEGFVRSFSMEAPPTPPGAGSAVGAATRCCNALPPSPFLPVKADSLALPRAGVLPTL